MQISQTVSFGQVENTFVSSWNCDNEIELRKGEDKVIFTISQTIRRKTYKHRGCSS